MTPLPLAGMRVLVTGVAGFIGMHAARRLAGAGAIVLGVDNFDPYYEVALKRARIAQLERLTSFAFETIDLADETATRGLFAERRFDAVLHLAAQPGVRHSLVNPEAYFRNNLIAFGHLLEGCRHARIAHLVYASSSSVYGANHVLPYSEDQNVDHPVSLYAATKKANELMAHSYSHLYRFPATALRFFTVYGPWGRPDMSPMIFTRAILAGEPITVFGDGNMRRDYTYIDDVVEATVRVLARPPVPGARDVTPAATPTNPAPHAIFNVGNHTPILVSDFIALLERLLGRAAIRRSAPMQPGEVPVTYAAIDRLAAATGFAPATALEDGLARFVAWYREHYADSGASKPGC